MEFFTQETMIRRATGSGDRAAANRPTLADDFFTASRVHEVSTNFHTWHVDVVPISYRAI